MQALYGYFTAVESIKEVKRIELEEMHALDPAKHDFADKALFEARKKQAVKLFNQNLLAGKVERVEDAEEEVVENVNTALSEFESQIHKEARIRKNDMMKEGAGVALLEVENVYARGSQGTTRGDDGEQQGKANSAFDTVAAGCQRGHQHQCQ